MPDNTSQWDNFRNVLQQAYSMGLGNWLAGAGNPSQTFNPFNALALPTPGVNYLSETYRGIGDMGQRARMMEDPNSMPVNALRTAISQNPILQNTLFKTETRPDEQGSLVWQGGRPVMRVGARLSPKDDPGEIALHELVGHGTHGNIVGVNPLAEAGIVAPSAEGFAIGSERGIYGPLSLSTRYDQEYGNSPYYKNALSIGAMVSESIARTGKIPSQQEILERLFGRESTDYKPGGDDEESDDYGRKRKK